jgi:23S rRNA pseudouridine1911/1915/1917 synthase
MKITITHSCSLFEGVKSFPGPLSNNTCKSWIKNGRITVNGVAKKDPRFILKAGDLVNLENKKKLLHPGVEILYEDDDCIVLTKPYGLLAVDSLDKEELSLHAIIKEYVFPEKVYPVQRLDEGTSGVMVFALNAEFKEALKAQFAKHTIQREYQAIVMGTLDAKKGRFRNFLKEDKKYFVHIVNRDGEEAITDYEILKEKNGLSFVNFKLHTGRKNQIRVQSAHYGIPILGDLKYGPIEQPNYYRLALHAHTLGFYHTKLEKQMTFHVKTPFSIETLYLP